MDSKPGLSKEELKQIIGQYDGESLMLCVCEGVDIGVLTGLGASDDDKDRVEISPSLLHATLGMHETSITGSRALLCLT